MFEISIVLAIAVIGLCFVLHNILSSKWENAPPGPLSLPIVGNLHQLAGAKQPLDVFQNWKEQHGDIVGIRMGNYRMVILNNYETIKEAFSMWEFSGRNLLKPFQAIAGKRKLGLTLSEGHEWTEQRRFALRNLRDFGFGKKSMDSLIQEDISDLIENFKQLEGKPFVPHRTFSTAVVRSLWNIMTGEKFPYGDPRFQAILDSVHSLLSSTPIAGPVFFMPWLVKIFPNWTGWNAFNSSIGNAKDLIWKYIEEHKRTFQPDSARDYIDVYLREIEKTQDRNSSFHKDNNAEKHLLVGTLNLFGAGAETTSNTIVWSLLYLIKYPQVQAKLFEEIKTIVGLSRLPSLDDRDKCPYALAVMEETLRISSLVPLGVFHNTMENVTFKGYHIPKDTLVAANIYGIHHDKKFWGDPETFRPERFLGNDKKNLGPVIAFSVGKRACLGEVLARNNYFLYLASLVQKFEFKHGEEGEIPVGASPGLTRSANEFKIILKERESN